MAQLSRVITNVEQTVRQILDALGGKLTFQENLFVEQITIADTGDANSILTVAHSLQFIPIGYIANIDRAGTVYDYARASWTSSQIQVKCSVANASVVLTLF